MRTFKVITEARACKEIPGYTPCHNKPFGYFILWIAEKKRQFFEKHPDRFIGPHVSDQDGFTSFCEGKTLKQD